MSKFNWLKHNAEQKQDIMHVNQQIAHYFDTEFCALLSMQDHLKIEHNYPKTWMDLYQQQNYASYDPVLNNTQHHFFFRHDLPLKDLSICQQQVMKHAQDFGIQSGITFNCVLQGQQYKYFSLASFETPEKFKFKIQQQMNNIFGFIYVLQKNIQTHLAVMNLTSVAQDYYQLTLVERQFNRQKFNHALIKLNLLEAKTMNMCVPQEIIRFMQTNYQHLRQVLVTSIQKML